MKLSKSAIVTQGKQLTVDLILTNKSKFVFKVTMIVTKSLFNLILAPVIFSSRPLALRQCTMDMMKRAIRMIVYQLVFIELFTKRGPAYVSVRFLE